MSTAPSSERIAAAALVNEAILRHVQDSQYGELEWEFLCECGEEDCHEHVFLTLDDYIELHDSGEAVLGGGHRLSQIGRARRLHAEAEALRRQALHQVKRAQKNLRDFGGPG